jgi:hypothetical protein
MTCRSDWHPRPFRCRRRPIILHSIDPSLGASLTNCISSMICTRLRTRLLFEDWGTVVQMIVHRAEPMDIGFYFVFRSLTPFESGVEQSSKSAPLLFLPITFVHHKSPHLTGYPRVSIAESCARAWSQKGAIHRIRRPPACWPAGTMRSANLPGLAREASDKPSFDHSQCSPNVAVTSYPLHR